MRRLDALFSAWLEVFVNHPLSGSGQKQKRGPKAAFLV
jgi:hypothetical protein